MGETKTQLDSDTPVFVTVSLQPIGVAGQKKAQVVQARLRLSDLDSADLPRLVREAVAKLGGQE